MTQKIILIKKIQHEFFLFSYIKKKKGKFFEDYLWGLLMCHREHKKFVYDA